MIKKNWQPCAELNTLHKRAAMLKIIRDYFQTASVLEVETPLLCSHTGTDPYIESFQTNNRFLQTSPEYAMKRLLASGSGSIFQICKAFRLEEAGTLHNPEFTMLEWYRVDFSMQQLMQDVAQLLQLLMPKLEIIFLTYEKLFFQYVNINPHNTTKNALINLLEKNNISPPNDVSIDDLLNLVLSSLIEPQLPNAAVFVHHYPPSQAALAQLDANAPHYALRFEVYLHRVEIANGFQELQNAAEQQQRFIANNQLRAQTGKPQIALDNYFLQALEHGLPNCSGVALGLDRVLQIICDAEKISSVLTFNWDNC